MSPNGIELTELPAEAISHLNLKYHLEWVMDPPPFILKRFPEELVQNIYRVKMKHLAKVAELEARLVQARGEMYADIANVIPDRG
jgi:hypothetical protein